MKESIAAFRAATRNPLLRRLQLGFAVSAIGYWAGTIAVTVFAYRAGGPAAVALQMTMRLVPSAIAAPLLSTLADRHSRVRLLVASDGLRCLVLFGMAALMAVAAEPITVYVGSAVAGILFAVFEPAKQALLPDLARDPEELTAANVVGSAIDSTSFFLGPAVGGLLLALGSPALVMGFTGMTVAWSAALAATIREPPRATAEDGIPDREPFLRAAGRGFTTVVREPSVRLIVGLIAAQVVVAGLEQALIAALALDVLRIGDGGVGFLSAALGVGGLAGAAAAVALVGRRRLATVLGIGCVLWGAPFVLIGAIPSVAVAAVGLAVVGLANTLVDVSAITLLQRVAPPQTLGRVFGILESLILGGLAIGAALAPALIALFGITGALVVQGLFLPLVIVATWAALRSLDVVADRGLAAAGGTLALLRRDPLFAPLPAPVIERLASVATPVSVPAGAAVFMQGDHGDRFYVVAGGRASVEIDGRQVHEHGPGESFGEIALLRDRPRTATVRAVTDLELMALERDEFVPAVTGYPSSAAAADQVVSRRMVRARLGAVTA